MKLGEAFSIFQQIDAANIPDDDKGTAIWRIMNMETHNGVTKDAMLQVIRYLYSLAFYPPADDKNEPLTLADLQSATKERPLLVWLVSLENDLPPDARQGWAMFDGRCFVTYGGVRMIFEYGKTMLAYPEPVEFDMI